jgi:hypothetical protein
VNRNIREKEVEEKEKQPVSYTKCEILPPSPQYNSSSKPNNRLTFIHSTTKVTFQSQFPQLQPLLLEII